MSFDGAFVIVRRSGEIWLARACRHNAIQFDEEGRPLFDDFLSEGVVFPLQEEEENDLALCFPPIESNENNPERLYYTLNENKEAVYKFFIFDSGPEEGLLKNTMRRRLAILTISDPFTKQAEIAQFRVETAEQAMDLTMMSTSSNTTKNTLHGLEPTMTEDGRFMVWNGRPDNSGRHDYLMYSYNAEPCALNGWSAPQPLHKLNQDPNPLLEQYPLSWQPLKAASGELYREGTPDYYLRGAYPWIDPDGRFLLYTAAKDESNTRGTRREAVSLIGADTLWTAYNIDGGINDQRRGDSRLFYSSPMWRYEQERHLTKFGALSRQKKPMLPVTHSHDVLPLFGSNTRDYNEVDVGDISDPFHILSLPMNELVTVDGKLDETRTPDLSGHFSTGNLFGRAYNVQQHIGTIQAQLVE